MTDQELFKTLGQVHAGDLEDAVKALLYLALEHERRQLPAVMDSLIEAGLDAPTLRTLAARLQLRATSIKGLQP